jgi:hypothetical protein
MEKKQRVSHLTERLDVAKRLWTKKASLITANTPKSMMPKRA